MSESKHTHDSMEILAAVIDCKGHGHTRTKAIANRLSRLIGHLSSVLRMVEDGRNCSEVLVQLAAVRSAINKTCEVILKDHMENSVAGAINTGDDKAMEELRHAMELLMKYCSPS